MQHKLGYAEILGSYAVIRALDDLGEMRALDDLLNRVPEEERAKLYQHRRRHKACMVLVHEIAHTLGGVHGKNPDAILFPAYSVEQENIEESAIASLALGVRYH
ncbi:MAG TPA: matrixin family metalloprotease, partial [Myxococcota bacterium]